MEDVPAAVACADTSTVPPIGVAIAYHTDWENVGPHQLGAFGSPVSRVAPSSVPVADATFTVAPGCGVPIEIAWALAQPSFAGCADEVTVTASTASDGHYLLPEY